LRSSDLRGRLLNRLDGSRLEITCTTGGVKREREGALTLWEERASWGDLDRRWIILWLFGLNTTDCRQARGEK
jgi:hypothetical protein